MHVLGSNELIEDVFNQDLCIGCGVCASVCPAGAIGKKEVA